MLFPLPCCSYFLSASPSPKLAGQTSPDSYFLLEFPNRPGPFSQACLSTSLFSTGKPPLNKFTTLTIVRTLFLCFDITQPVVCFIGSPYRRIFFPCHSAFLEVVPQTSVHGDEISLFIHGGTGTTPRDSYATGPRVLPPPPDPPSSHLPSIFYPRVDWHILLEAFPC